MLTASHPTPPTPRLATALALAIIVWVAAALPIATTTAADGVLTLITRDDGDNTSVPARLELRAATGRRPLIRRTIPSGPGVSLPNSLELPLNNGQYQFKITRGPEYRVITGNFEIQPTAIDQRVVDLPRMVDMRSQGYLSGDMAALFPETNLRLRMATEDLHVVALVVAPPSAAKSLAAEPRHIADKTLAEKDQGGGPQWHSQRATARGDLLYYSLSDADQPPAEDADGAPREPTEYETRAPSHVAIANPFSLQLPLHLADEQIDGIFLLGDWLREGAPLGNLSKIRGTRPPQEIGFTGALGPGRYAEAIYWRILEAGLTPVPLAGTGTQVATPASTWAAAAIGYNRTYAIGKPLAADDRRVQPIASESEYFDAVWAGRSMLTNGPLLRPTLGGYAPGHRFEARSGEALELAVELHLAVRDPVEYLEVIHNGNVFYSARLDEFAEAGGKIPILRVDQSGWVMVRVVTEHPEHFRAAISAPWFFEFDQQPRVSRRAVEFFAKWLVDCEDELKKLPADQLAPYIQPVRAARDFWRQRLQSANVD